MFGFLVCNKAELTENEKIRYQSAYCGLCRTLKEKYGNIERLSLNCDMTFLALFLSSLYEPEETEADFRCGVHPTQKRHAVFNPYVEYAADMTILYSYYNCMDDWVGDRKLGKLRYSRCLKRHLPAIREKYPRQYAYAERKMKEFAELKQNAFEVSDDLINASGELLRELFVYKEDCWSEYLRKFGYELGRFIYLMGMAIDYEQDKKSGKCNPFLRKRAELDMKEVRDILRVMIGDAAEQFEMLPVVRDEHLLKSILYDGVWTRFRMKISGKETCPDFYPEDPETAERMSPVNETYEYPMNPGEYQKQEGWRKPEILRPERQAGDSETINQAVDFVNIGRYVYANQILDTVTSRYRDARWNYLSSLANYGMGNTVAAMTLIRRALQMEPGNEAYESARQAMYHAGNTYSANGQEYQMPAADMNRF